MKRTRSWRWFSGGESWFQTADEGRCGRQEERGRNEQVAESEMDRELITEEELNVSAETGEKVRETYEKATSTDKVPEKMPDSEAEKGLRKKKNPSAQNQIKGSLRSMSSWVSSWRIAFLTLRDETLVSPPRATVFHLLNQLIYSQSDSLIAAAPNLPPHEVTSDLMLLMELARNISHSEGIEDVTQSFTKLSHLVPPVIEYLNFSPVRIAISCFCLFVVVECFYLLRLLIHVCQLLLLFCLLREDNNRSKVNK
ncbi:hypothetical protein BUALT_Bualt05G0000700 [Buddleja alternifolia]|uniref:Uncharacterized protein n=1 Tax=Buddleja alternifolia TaxID=168488 RepID=A0AAV6XNT8_9LAMI|nr:hypothetical protein BUALT_Bualt05G0000700 [Buddleja alternifolia]